MQPQFRSSEHDIGNLLVGTPDGQQIPMSQLASDHAGKRCVFHLSGKQLALYRSSIQHRGSATSQRAVNEAQKAVNESSPKLPQGYRLSWGGEYSEYWSRLERQLVFIGPLAVVLIFVILFALYGNFKFPVTVVIGVVMTEPVGALLALKLTHMTFSVSSVLGLLVLMGVSAETAIIDVSYINKLRQKGRAFAKPHWMVR